MTENGITPVMPVGGDNGFMWIFGLLILLGLFNGGGFGFGGNGGYATSAEVQRGFDAQNTTANQREILSATNQSFHDSLAAMQSLYNETARDIAELRVGQANAVANQSACCCETKQLIMQNNYDSALRDAATNANFTAQIQSVKDMMAQNKIEALQSQINALNLQNAMAGVVRYPMATMYSVPSPLFPDSTTGTTTGG